MTKSRYGTPERPAPNRQQYLAGLQRIEITEERRKMLSAHLNAPNCSITATEMTREVFGKEGHQTANLRYGTLAGDLAKAMGVDISRPQYNHDKVTFLVTFRDDADRGCVWQLHENLALALRELNM